jgi:hypothetical protein
MTAASAAASGWSASGGGTFGGGVDLFGGSGNTSVYIYSDQANAVTEVKTGSGNDSVMVSSPSGTLDTFPGVLAIDEGAGSNSLSVSEVNAVAGDNLGISGNVIGSSMHPLTIYYYANGGSFGGGIFLTSGMGNDGITIYGAPAGSALFINTGGGNDVVIVQVASASAYSLNVHGGGGSSLLSVQAAPGGTFASAAAGVGTTLVTVSYGSGAISFIYFADFRSLVENGIFSTIL